MAYKALYRQFRPRRFADLKGQDMIAKVLKNQVMAGEPAHAYLFAGPRGTGKTSTAKILASALNCLHPVEGEPCLECENCRAALNDSMMDIIEMDAASNNGVDNARDIRDKAGLLPTKGKYKIYIIDEVHMLTGQAFNALLKTLEEPPAHVVFILATTELDALPKTVLSRCLRFDFKFIDRQRVVERMQEVLAQTGATAEEDALYEIAEASEGAMRDALTILEKCCAFGVKVDREVVASVLGRASGAAMHDWMQSAAEYDEKQALLKMRKILDSGVECGAAVAQVLHSYEQVLLSKICGEQNEWSAYGELFSREALLRGIEVFTEAQSRMKFAPKPEIILEAAILRAMLPAVEKEKDELIWREEIARLEAKLAALQRQGLPRAAQQESAPQEVQQPQAQAPAKAAVSRKQKAEKAPSARPEEEYWPWLRASCAADLGAQPMFRGLELLREDANTIYLRAANPVVRMMIESGERKQELQEKMEKRFGRYKNIQVELAGPSEQLPEEAIIDIID